MCVLRKEREKIKISKTHHKPTLGSNNSNKQLSEESVWKEDVELFKNYTERDADMGQNQKNQQMATIRRGNGILVA